MVTSPEGIAVIGMAGRFPKATNIDRLWSNLISGRECIQFFSPADLADAGVPDRIRSDPSYVAARGILDAPYDFDCDFFSYSPAEAATIDPQQRVFLELSWEALENAGYAATTMAGSVGVFGSAGLPTYLLSQMAQGLPVAPEAAYQLLIGNDKDYLATRVSYKLNLSGPSLSIQTACSSSLVAVHYACQALLAGECDVALAGGVSISLPQISGYQHRQGMIMSSDGHCRPFDSLASGTLEGNGGAVVVLKPLRAALADGDSIRAVLLGTAVNNDGAGKVGYTAPSIERQAMVIREALSVAVVDPDEVSYVEAHGTGTEVGDPIEVAALNRAFASGRRSECPIGSIKSNIGHLNAAAGIAGLVKTILSLENECIPASINFSKANTKIPFDEGPFYVADRAIAWPRAAGRRVAGVSSFGIGGTNAHVVLRDSPNAIVRDSQEFVYRAAASAAEEPEGAELLVLSARTSAALALQRERLAETIETMKGVDLADVAHTLQVGRVEFVHRWTGVVKGGGDARAVLLGGGTARDATKIRMVWMFPGQGAQRPGMGADLYKTHPVFRSALDSCAGLLEPLLKCDIRPYVISSKDSDRLERELVQTAIAQPVLFSYEYSLAQLLLSLGLKPTAMLGHSLGEFTAACIAGVMSLEDSLIAVSERGRLMQAQPPGAMLAVEGDPAAIRGELVGGVVVAAQNGPASLVVAGPLDAIERTYDRLTIAGHRVTRLSTSHAFHSPMMDEVCTPFEGVMMNRTLRRCEIPVLSGVSGGWLTDDRAVDPRAWADQIRKPVNFAEMIKTASEPSTVFVEIGPGRTLSEMVRRMNLSTSMEVVSLQRADKARGGDVSFLDGVGALWALGAKIDWSGLRGGSARRLPLPTYPFERRALILGSYEGLRLRNEVSGTEGFSPLRPNAGGRASSGRKPSTELEVLVAKHWQDVLGLSDISAEENFFDLGGTSLLAVDLLGRLRIALGLGVPARTLFDHPTISEMAEQILGEVDAMSESNAEALLARLDRQGSML